MTTVEELELNAPKKMKRTAFFYTPADSIFMKLNPLTRIAIGLVLNFLPFFIYFSTLMRAAETGTTAQLLPGILLNIGVILTAFALLIMANFSLRQLKKFAMLFVILTVTLTISYVLLGTWSDAEIFLFNLGPFPIFKENVIRGVEAWTRFVAGIISVLFILATCDERDFVKAMGTLHFPYPLIFIVSVAIRGLTTFYDDYMLILSAQQSRGLDMDRMNIIRKAMVYSSILVPLFMVEFNRAEDMANAIDSRAFSIRGGAKRTDYITAQSKFYKKDWILIIGSVFVTVYSFLFLFFSIDIIAISAFMLNPILAPLALILSPVLTPLVDLINLIQQTVWTFIQPLYDLIIEAGTLPD